MILETGLSTFNISRVKRAPNTINFVDMRLVLVLLATFVQPLFNLFNVQNLNGLYALCNICVHLRLFPHYTDLNADLDFGVYHPPRQSWFNIHYSEHWIPDGFFKQQLWVLRATFNQLLNNVSPHVARQDTSMRNCIPAEKILAIVLCRLTHGNSYVSIGKSTVIEAVQDVKLLYDQWNHYFKVPTMIVEMTECIATFERTRSELPNVAGAIDHPCPILLNGYDPW